MRFSSTVAALLVTAAVVAANDNWPQFRGPNGDGQSDSHGVPTHWSETENVRWKTAIHDKGWSSPVVFGNQVWVTTARADGKAYYAVCLDRGTGNILHDLQLFTEEDPAFCHPFNSYASPTPVVEAGRLYAHFGSHGTACVDTATGRMLWQRHDLKCDHFRGPGSSPVICGNLLVLIFDGYDVQYVTALDKLTGRTVWRTDRNIDYHTDNGDLKKAYATPAILQVNGQLQLVCPSASATVAYDPATGRELWRVNHGGMNAASRPVAGKGLVYLTSGHTKRLLAVRLSGHGDLTNDGVAWTVRRDIPTRPSLLLEGSLLFFVSDDGIASCLDALTGKQIWRERLGGSYSGSPVEAEGHIYFSDDSGKTHVLAASREYRKIAVNRLDAGCMASPAIAGDCLFLRTKTHLYCLGRSSTR